MPQRTSLSHPKHPTCSSLVLYGIRIVDREGKHGDILHSKAPRSCYASNRWYSNSSDLILDIEVENPAARFALEHLEVWREIIMDWVVVGGTRVLVTHYEDFLQDKMGQLRRVLGYLNIAPDSRRLQCVEFADLEFYKRRSSQSTKHLFTKKLKYEFNKAIDEVNKILKGFGHKIIKRK